jgi:hypothetical protein
MGDSHLTWKTNLDFQVKFINILSQINVCYSCACCSESWADHTHKKPVAWNKFYANRVLLSTRRRNYLGSVSITPSDKENVLFLWFVCLYVVYLTTLFQYLGLYSVDFYSVLIRLPSSSEAGETRVRNMAEFCRRARIVLVGFFNMP